VSGWREDSQDTNFIRALRLRGVNVMSATEACQDGCEDEEHLEWATSQGRVLFSFNARDFFRPHTLYLTQGKSHAGIILAQQQRYSVGELVRRLVKLITAKSAEEMKDWIEFLSAWS
jgi:hypothetical protein